MKYTLFAAAAALCLQVNSGEVIPKKAGVSFRFDDNHDVNTWKPMIEVFDRHGMKAGLSINPGWLKQELALFLKETQANGHEIMNHTPYHRYYVLRFPNESEAQKYAGKPGVDHVNGAVVCFTCIVPDKAPGGKKSLKADLYQDGRIKFEKNKILKPGSWSKPFYIKPYDKKFYLLDRKPDKDGYYQLYNLWREPVKNLKPANQVTCVFISTELKLTPEAFIIEGENAHKQFAKWGIKQPGTWIHPGCGDPLVHAENIKKSYGDKYGYKSAAVYINKSAKTFNEYDPDGLRRFAMQWGNFRSEFQTLPRMQTIIADSIACNRVAFDGSHMRGTEKLGGQKEYLKRMDALLTWLKANDIPVRTQSEWADILYSQKADPKCNVFPSFSVDLDKNDRPDGIFPSKDAGVIVLKDGAKALESKTAGVIFKIKKLGGLEKGDNKLSLRFEAGKNARITFDFTFDNGARAQAVFTGNGEWQDVCQTIKVPKEASCADVTVSNDTGSPMVLGDISLSK